ncbi:MAG: hypothetical protein ACI87E_002450 [Mariniblastus sp.]|jgi:hypothetical protein
MGYSPECQGLQYAPTQYLAWVRSATCESLRDVEQGHAGEPRASPEFNGEINLARLAKLRVHWHPCDVIAGGLPNVLGS